MDFELVSAYQPTGDQPEAIRQLVQGIQEGITFQTLLGVTGSGKTFTMANVIEQVKKPTLILSHNKTLAAQLYAEFKQFFPNNSVEYFVSYYDYYQPEAYIPVTNTYIEKDLSINDEIEKLRLAATSALLSGRRDIIVVASVSCIYGIGNPNEFKKSILPIHVGMEVPRNKFLHRLVENLYTRSEDVFERGMFRVTGDTVDIYLAYADHVVRVLFFGDEIEGIQSIDPFTNHIFETHSDLNLYPANLFVSSPENTLQAIHQIQDDLVFQVEQFKKQGRLEESNRLYERVSYDLEMIRELGYCSGIENYSRYFDNRQPGERPFCLLDYFPENFLMMVDESHVTLPQVKGMYGGDRARKTNLIEYGFRLQAAIDNRPLKYEEFEGLLNQCVFVSATPAALEVALSEGIMVEQVIRPTGLLDPIIEVRPSRFQIDNLIEEIQARVALNERALVTTLTKRMAEELQKYLTKVGVNCQYIHSDIDTLDRVEILRELRIGTFDVLIGVNLLREGLDLPEVSLVAILDADKEGFLRNVKSLVQTVGRAARNVNGRVIMYADKMTDSMRLTIEETERRRAIQIAYNDAHGLTPQPLNKPIDAGLRNSASRESNYQQGDKAKNMREAKGEYQSIQAVEKEIKQLKKEMQRAAKELDFILAASIRDQIIMLEKLKETL
ncbi:MAG: excinuclease ABC subunit UvrB [Crocinitomicaceae bacterium]|nr:excinuclease ABC subunit UvrB [Crocinitomicaceae bacterium]